MRPRPEEISSLYLEFHPLKRLINADPSTAGEKLIDTTLLHERFGDVMNECVFNGLCRVTQLVIGAVPAGGITHDGDVATIHVFGKTVGSAPSTARFECLYERLQQPETGSVTVPLNGVITQHLVFRGKYQTVPICVYGWKLDDLAAGYDIKDGAEAEVDHSVEVLHGDECVFGAGRLVGKDVLSGRIRDRTEGGDLSGAHKDLSLAEILELCDKDRLSSIDSLASLSTRLQPLVNVVYENEFPIGVSTSATDTEDDLASLTKRQLLANKAVSWISALFAVIHGGSAPTPALVLLASTGLDLLVVALQDARVAREFAIYGGCAILRCILGVRGLPGSFYNKAIALSCEVVRQAGEAGLKGLQEAKASEWRLHEERGFFEVVEDGDGGKQSGKQSGKEGVSRGRKRKTSPTPGAEGDSEERAKDMKRDNYVEDDSDIGNQSVQLQKELADIENGAYAGRIRDLWEEQLRSRTTLAEAILGHGGRFKPNAGTTHINVISKVLDFGRALHIAVRELKELRQCLDDLAEARKAERMEDDDSGDGMGTVGGIPDLSKNIASTEDALQELAGIVARTRVCDLSDSLDGYRESSDVWDALLLQIFAKLLSDCAVLEAITDLIKCVDEVAYEIEGCGATLTLDGKVVGSLSAMAIEFFSAMLDRPECLSFSTVNVLQRTGSSLLLASDANPHVVAYKGYVARVESMIDVYRTLVRLAAADWGSFDTLELPVLKLNISFDAMMFRGVGEALLEKCRRALGRYIRAKMGATNGDDDTENDEVPTIKELEISLYLALGVLQRLLAAADPQLLRWWIPKSCGFYQMMATLVGYKGFFASEEFAMVAQKVMGGLVVCAQIHNDRNDSPNGAGTPDQSDVDDENSPNSSLEKVVDILSSHLPWTLIKDNTDGVMDASEYFDVLDAAFFGNTVTVSMSWDDVRLLVDDADILGQLLTSVSILRSYLEYSSDGAATVQRLGGNNLLMRALVCATEVLSASRADDHWTHRVGTSIDFCSMANNKAMATEFFENVTRCMYFYLKGVAKIARVESLPLLQTLIKAHAAVAIDTQAMMDAGLKTSFIDYRTLSMRNARWNTTRALRFWISCPGLRPRVIPTALVGAVAAPSKSGCSVSFSPTAMLCLALLLGDIFPSEWPKNTSMNELAPEDKKYRASLTEELESCIVPLEYMISCCASSDLSYIRSATVRFLCKGAGLGGGMGTFLMGIISTQLDEALLPMTCAQVGMYDARKVLELLVPLLYQPALKAAALDTTIPQTIAKMVETIMNQSITFGAAFDKVESSSLVTMALECLTALADPSVTLDVFGLDRPADASDVIRLEAGAAICCTILDHITIIGENVPLALNLLEIMTENRRGRENILHGIVKLCTKTQAEQIEHPTSEQILTAAQWLIQHYQAIKLNADEHAPDEIAKETTKYVFGTLEIILKRACVGGLHYDVDLPSMDSRTAPVKFAAQAKEATSRGARRFIPDFPCNGGHIQLLQDCQELAVFWKNQALRPIAPVSAVTNAAKLSKYVNWDIGSETMDKFCIAGILHPWLTHPRRPLNESMRVQPAYDPEDLEHPGHDHMDMEAMPNADTDAQKLAHPGGLPVGEQSDKPSTLMDGKEADDENKEASKDDKKDAMEFSVEDIKQETDATAAIDTQVNVDLGALSDLFRQQPPPSETAQAADEEDIDDDFDLYADLMPATVAPTAPGTDAEEGDEEQRAAARSEENSV